VALSSLWLFWVAPILGGVIGGYIAPLMFYAWVLAFSVLQLRPARARVARGAAREVRFEGLGENVAVFSQDLHSNALAIDMFARD
jgi:hypothetical protein